jgi:hypothetical protein
MINIIYKYLATIRLHKTMIIIAATLVIVGSFGGSATNAVSTKDTVAGHQTERSMMQPHDLVGSYEVTGTDPDGRPYSRARIVDISLAPSGALELEWNNGNRVGVGRIVGDMLTVAGWNKDQIAIIVMTINRDGSLSGEWSRRRDRGYLGTETWKKL